MQFSFLVPNSRLTLGVLLAIVFPLAVRAQSDSTLQVATLENVVNYALTHQPAVQQARIDEEITSKAIRGRLADWYPQVNAAFLYQRNYDIQPIVFNGELIRAGVFNTSSAQFTATQAVFNRDVLLASSTAKLVRLQAAQNTSRTKNDAVVAVTKAFYDVLATSQQIKVQQESIVRLQRSLKDALNRYNAGVADKTDYKRAAIQLNNTEVALKSAREQLLYKKEYLKTLVGYPISQPLEIAYDTLQMEEEIYVDTLSVPQLSNHINYRFLESQRDLQQANVRYSRWAFIPTVSINGAYNFLYFNNSFDKLYNVGTPVSFVGGTVALPIYQGGKRRAKIQEQKWALRRIDVGLNNLESQLNTEYTRAIATYKSNLKNYLAQKENVASAKEVYDVLQLQYSNGVRTYLDVIVAETDLRTTRVNYFNALYQVLASKMDVLWSLNQIKY